jgi:hypothetical protein
MEPVSNDRASAHAENVSEARAVFRDALAESIGYATSPIQ